MTGLTFSNQIESLSLPLNGLNYNAKNNIFEVSAEKVDYSICHSKNIRADYGIEWFHDIAVIDRNNNPQVIEFIEVVSLASANV